MAIRLYSGESLVLPPMNLHWTALVRRLSLRAVIATMIMSLLDGLEPNAVAALGVRFGRLLPAAEPTVGTVVMRWASPDVRFLATTVILCVLSLAAVATWLVWVRPCLTVTDQRVILRTGGLIQIRSKAVALDRVLAITASQTLLGRLLDCGRVDMELTHNRFVTVKYVGAPEMLRDQLFLLAEVSRRRAD